MTILITGSGFIGSHIAKDLVDRGKKPILYDASPKINSISDIVDINKIKVVKGDILDLPQLLDVVKKENVERIIHTAALKNLELRENPYIGVKINIEGTLNILEIARIMDIKRVVFTSSGSMYFNSHNLKNNKISEESLSEDFPIKTLSGRPSSIYPTTKIICEFLGLNYFDEYGLDFVAVRYAAVFGPWNLSGGPTQVLMKDIIEKSVIDKRVIVKGSLLWSGSQELVYIKDVVMGTILACYVEKPKTRVYNIGLGRTYKFEDVIEIVKVVIPDAQIIIRGIPKGIYGLYGLQTKPFNLKKANDELRYFPNYDLKRAIYDYVEWINKKANN